MAICQPRTRRDEPRFLIRHPARDATEEGTRDDQLIEGIREKNGRKHIRLIDARERGISTQRSDQKVYRLPNEASKFMKRFNRHAAESSQN